MCRNTSRWVVRLVCLSVTFSNLWNGRDIKILHLTASFSTCIHYVNIDSFPWLIVVWVCIKQTKAPLHIKAINALMKVACSLRSANTLNSWDTYQHSNVYLYWGMHTKCILWNSLDLKCVLVCSQFHSSCVVISNNSRYHVWWHLNIWNITKSMAHWKWMMLHIYR